MLLAAPKVIFPEEASGEWLIHPSIWNCGKGLKSLCGEKKTQERIQHTLKTGKTLQELLPVSTNSAIEAGLVLMYNLANAVVHNLAGVAMVSWEHISLSSWKVRVRIPSGPQPRSLMGKLRGLFRQAKLLKNNDFYPGAADINKWLDRPIPGPETVRFYFYDAFTPPRRGANLRTAAGWQPLASRARDRTGIACSSTVPGMCLRGGEQGERAGKGRRFPLCYSTHAMMSGGRP